MTAKPVFSKIKGDWMQDGFLQGRDELLVTIDDKGSMRDFEYGWILEVTQFRGDCPLITGPEVAFTFAPDLSEIDRLKLPIRNRSA